MTCGIGVAIIWLLFVILVGLVLAERRRAKSYEEYRGHIPARTIPADRDMPPTPPKKKD